MASSRSEKLECVRNAFARVDKDGSGTIDIGELENLLNQAAIYPSPAELDILYKRMDKDKDGEISFDEFYDAMVADFEEQEMEEEFKAMKDIFALADKDGSQRLTVKELKAFLRMLGVSISTPGLEDAVVGKLYDRMKEMGGDAARGTGSDSKASRGSGSREEGVSIDEFAAFLLQHD